MKVIAMLLASLLIASASFAQTKPAVKDVQINFDDGSKQVIPVKPPELPPVTPPVVPPTTQPPATQVAGRPGAANTGWSGNLIPSVSISVIKSGTVLENLDIKGVVNVDANDVTIRNCRITSPASRTAFAVKQDDNFSGLVIEDCEITGPTDCAIVFSRGIIRRNELHHLGGDAIKPRGDCLIEGNWVHHIGLSPGSHADAVQIRSGEARTPIAGIKIIRNFFDIPHAKRSGQVYRPELMGTGSNACIFVECPTPGMVVDGNWLNGGNYCVGNGGGVYRNNIFGRDMNWSIWWGKGGWNPAKEWENNNRWEDTGEIIKF